MSASREDLAAALNDAGGLRLIRVGHLAGSRVYMTFDWQGQRLEFTASITEAIHANIPDKPRSRARDVEAPTVMRERLKQRDGWTEDQLRVEGLPLFYSAEWLRGALARLGSYAEIERVYGYAETTLSDVGQRHGIEIKPRLKDDQKERARELLAQGKTPGAVAKELGMIKTTVQRIQKKMLMEATPSADQQDTSLGDT